MFLTISQISQENTCVRVSFLIKLLKKRLWHRCFPVNFTEFLRINQSKSWKVFNFSIDQQIFVDCQVFHFLIKAHVQSENSIAKIRWITWNAWMETSLGYCFLVRKRCLQSNYVFYWWKFLFQCSIWNRTWNLREERGVIRFPTLKMIKGNQ